MSAGHLNPVCISCAMLFECASLKSFVEEPKPIAVPDEQLNAIVTAILKQKERSIEWVTLEFFAHYPVKAIMLLAEVCWSGVGENQNLRGKA